VVLPDEILTLAVLGVAVLTVVLLVVVLVLALRLRRLRSAYEAVLEPERGEDLFDVLRRYRGEVGQLRDDLGIVHDNTEHLRDLLRVTVSRVGVVRYDAFDDMGGALSFSAAFLDEGGDGVVISTINGRTEARTYAKAVAGGTSEHHLSPEEEEAIEIAVRRAAPTGERSGRRGRRRAAS
jgi:hypothetical protein